MAWVAMALLATYLIFAGGNWWGIYTPPLRIVTMACAAGLLGAWAVIAWRRPAWRPRSVMFPAVAACLASLAISTAFSRSPRISLEYLGYAIVLAALYLLLVRLFADPFFRQRLPVLALMLLAVIVGAFLVRVALTWVEWWSLLGHISMPPLRPNFEGLTFGNPSAVLTMVVLLAVPAAATFGSGSRTGIAVLGAILLALAVVALISGSRAGWIALAITGGALGPVWLAFKVNRDSLRAVLVNIWRRRVGRVGLTALIIGGLIVAALVAPTVISRATAGGEDIRLTFSKTAFRMFAASPIVGTGPGMWVVERMAFANGAEVDGFVPHAHNLESQSLAELGLVGAAAALVLVANVIWLLRDALRSDDALRRRWSWTAVAGLSYFVLHQLFDLYVNMPAFLFAAAIPIAYLDATKLAAPKRIRYSQAPAWASALGGVAVVLAILGLMAQEGPAMNLARAVDAANRGDWAAADGPARAAAAADPDVGSYQFTAGLTAARAGDHAYALLAFKHVAENDDLSEGWLNLAAEQAELGQVADAADSIRRALRLGLRRPAVAVPAGDLALRLGDLPLATEAFAGALVRIPSFAADPWWQEEPTRAGVLRVAAAAAAADPIAVTGIRWELALMSGNERLALSLTADPGGIGFAPDLIRAWGGEEAAIERVFASCRAQPLLDASRLIWCARLANRAGDTQGAAAFRRLADILQESSGVNGGESRVARVEYNKITGSAADLWGLFTYRRATPWDILVPSLVHLTIE